MSDFNNVANITKQKVSAVRLRTWTLTLVILFAIVFYLVVNIMTSNSFIGLISCLFAPYKLFLIVCIFLKVRILGVKTNHF